LVGADGKFKKPQSEINDADIIAESAIQNSKEGHSINKNGKSNGGSSDYQALTDTSDSI